MQEEVDNLEKRLLQNGCVVLYHNSFLMEEHANQLVSSGWKYKEAYIAETGQLEEFFDQIALALEFPDYFGRNMNALNDCLSDIVFPESRRLAVGLERFDIFASRDMSLANTVLDIFAGLERHCLMRNERILFLVQSGDPDLRFSPVGGTPVMWNYQEWLNADRKKIRS
jgi:RNAse (barnase) inhibitor barstar